MNKCIGTLVFTALVTILFLFIKNKSNFPTVIVLPLLVAAITKYVIGDWDVGYKWGMMDVYYWMLVICVSYLTIIVYKNSVLIYGGI